MLLYNTFTQSRLHDIGTIPQHLFADLLRLDLLDLSYNNLTKVENIWFQDVSSGLKSLNLSHNVLHHLGANNLSSLESVEDLDLSYNSITTVHEQAFQSLHNSLQLLNLSYNQVPKVTYEVQYKEALVPR